LVLEAFVLAEEEVRALARRRTVALVVVELHDARAQRVAVADALEIRERHGVLGLDPRGRLGRRLVLEPAVRVGDLRAVIVVYMVDCLRHGIRRWLRGEQQGRERRPSDCRAPGRERADVHGIALSRLFRLRKIMPLASSVALRQSKRD
jgi:hypothetical protein